MRGRLMKKLNVNYGKKECIPRVTILLLSLTIIFSCAISAVAAADEIWGTADGNPPITDNTTTTINNDPNQIWGTADGNPPITDNTTTTINNDPNQIWGTADGNPPITDNTTTTINNDPNQIWGTADGNPPIVETKSKEPKMKVHQFKKLHNPENMNNRYSFQRK